MAAGQSWNSYVHAVHGNIGTGAAQRRLWKMEGQDYKVALINAQGYSSVTAAAMVDTAKSQLILMSEANADVTLITKERSFLARNSGGAAFAPPLGLSGWSHNQGVKKTPCAVNGVLPTLAAHRHRAKLFTWNS